MANTLDLTSLELLQTNSDWLKQAKSEPIFMVRPFDTFLSDLSAKDMKSYFKMFSSQIEIYKKLWGEPAFIFNGRSPWKTWIFKLAENEHLILFSDKDGGTSFEYAGLMVPSDKAFEKATGILLGIKDLASKRHEPDDGYGM